MSSGYFLFDGDFIWLMAALILSAFLTLGVLRLANKLGFIDEPFRTQSSSSRTVPRGGGLGFVITFLLIAALGVAMGFINRQLYFTLISGGLIIAGISLRDDYKDVPAFIRLVCHIFVASFLLWRMGGVSLDMLGIFHFPASHFIQVIIGNSLALLAFVWIINLINLMDGLDGLAASQAIIVALGGVLFSWLGNDLSGALLFSLLAASVAGFLIWNWPPARIFMGDVGSCFLGYILGALAIRSLKIDTMSVPIWLILLGVFMTDAGTTLVRRLLRRERWWTPHCKHAVQHAAYVLDSHWKVTSTVILINTSWLLPLSCMAWIWREFAWQIVLIAYLPLVWAAYCMGSGIERSEWLLRSFRYAKRRVIRY